MCMASHVGIIVKEMANKIAGFATKTILFPTINEIRLETSAFIKLKTNKI